MRGGGPSNDKPPSDLEEDQQQIEMPSGIEVQNYEEVDNSESDDLIDNFIDNEPNLNEQIPEERKENNTTSSNEDLYRQEDDEANGQNEPVIKGPFQFNFTNIMVTRNLRPPNIMFVDSSAKQQQ